MILWAAYQIGNVVIIMNLLIALMNATIAGIQEDKIIHWRFARTQVIEAKYEFQCFKIITLDLETILWPSLHLLPPCSIQSSGNDDESSHHDHQDLCEQKKRMDASEVELESPAERGDSKEKVYLDLVLELCDRYILKKKKMESLSACCQSSSYNNKY